MSLDANKALVRRFVKDVLDAGQSDLVYDLFSPDDRVQYPHQSEPRVGVEVVETAMAQARARQTSITTHIDLLIAEDDLVAARVRHDVVFRTDIPSRNGILKRPAGKLACTRHLSDTQRANRRAVGAARRGRDPRTAGRSPGTRGITAVGRATRLRESFRRRRLALARSQRGRPMLRWHLPSLAWRLPPSSRLGGQGTIAVHEDVQVTMRASETEVYWNTARASRTAPACAWQPGSKASTWAAT